MLSVEGGLVIMFGEDGHGYKEHLKDAYSARTLVLHLG